MKRSFITILLTIVLFCSACGEKPESIVKVIIPSEYVSEALTQEDCNKMATDDNYKSITINEDGSLTYEMTETRHSSLVKAMKEGYLNELESLKNNDIFSFVAGIEVNDELTDFKITVTTNTVDEGASYLAGYIANLGNTFQIYSGGEPQNVHVQVISQITEEVLYDLTAN